MSQLITGSLDVAQLKSIFNNANHTFTSKNGKTYLNFSAWVNDEPDKFGNTISFHVSEKQADGTYSKVYFGNAKPFQKNESPF